MIVAMNHDAYTDAYLRAILEGTRVVAVVGASHAAISPAATAISRRGRTLHMAFSAARCRGAESRSPGSGP